MQVTLLWKYKLLIKKKEGTNESKQKLQLTVIEEATLTEEGMDKTGYFTIKDRRLLFGSGKFGLFHV